MSWSPPHLTIDESTRPDRARAFIAESKFLAPGVVIASIHLADGTRIGAHSARVVQSWCQDMLALADDLVRQEDALTDEPIEAAS